MNDGTSTARTIVASSAIAIARPAPNSRNAGISPAIKPLNAAIMISAAAVITRPDRCNPSATAYVLSPLASQASRIRDTRKTS
jgi:hypothetical protein